MELTILNPVHEPEIVFKNAYFIIINKPEGMLVHPDGSSEELTVADWVVTKFPETKEVGETQKLKNGISIFRPGIVHRIDRGTSGLLIIARTQEAYVQLKEMFKGREIRKEYRALAYGIFKNEHEIIDKPIGRNAGDFRKWSAEHGARGELRDAITEYFVLSERRMGKELMNVLSRPKGSATINGLTYIQLFPKTGRTHQLRVHLKSIGHSIVNDELYATSYPRIKESKRMMLHAYALTIPAVEGKWEEVNVVSEIPKDMSPVLDLFK